MKRFSIFIIMILTASGLSSCASQGDDEQKRDEAMRQDLKPIVIRVSGYGTYENEKDRVSERKRLMTMRASRLDAYRALAERVYGTVIFGSSTVKEFVLTDDNYRTMVDSVIRGAKVITVTEHTSGTFETVVELVLDARFQECLTHVNTFKYSDECRLPLPHGGDDKGDIQVSNKGTESLYYLK